MKTFTCALVGLGNMGANHAKLLRGTPGFEVTAVFDPSPAAAQAAQALGGLAYYPGVQEMLDREKPELVVIVTPHHLHAAPAIAALRSGAHVVVEKPMAPLYADCQAMIAAAKAAGRTLTVYHSRHNDSWVRAAAAVTQAGTLGRLVELHTSWPSSDGPVTWRSYKHESGGLFYDLGAHLTEYILQLADSPVVAVGGQVFRRPEKDPKLNEDHCVAHIHFASGAVGHVTSSTLELADVRRFHVVGDAGTLTDDWNWGGGKIRVAFRMPNGNPAWTEIYYGPTAIETTGRLFYDNLAAHLRGEGPPLISAESAALVINILNTAERSAAQGGAPLPLG